MTGGRGFIGRRLVARLEALGHEVRVLTRGSPCHPREVQGDLLDAPWPKVDPEALKQDEIELMLQINGKLRGSLLVPAGASKDEIEKAALACEAFAKSTSGEAVKRVIVVPGRLVNVVVG